MKIPKYKRDEYIFVSNLKDVTADPYNPLTLRRDAYLLSENYTTKSAIKRALWLRSKRNLLVSDNGNFSRMEKIAAEFKNEGLNILNNARKELKEKGQTTEETLMRRKRLMDAIIKKCKTELEILDINKIVNKQLSINPHYMIGMEDFTTTVMMLCNLMDPIFNPYVKDIRKYQEQTVDIFKRQIAGESTFKDRLKERAMFLVLHAYDYDSAFQGASNIFDIQKDGIAISYGGPMHSNRWITHLKFGNIIERFNEKLPESYLIAQSITLGAVNGHPDNIPYHILGVGSPILIALIGYLLRHSKAVSIDSTAPFKDAFAGTIYGCRYAYLKMDMYKLVANALIKDKPYTSETPFFRIFNKRYPNDWKSIRDKLNVRPSTDIKELRKKIIAEVHLLEKYLPFFSKLRAGNKEFMYQLRIARAGHNYWILRNICKNVLRRRHTSTLKMWIEKQLDRYVKIANPKWAIAVKKSYELTEKYRELPPPS